MMGRTMPMFPLGSVLVPSLVLPLHVFEDRYKAMIDDVLGGDQMLGVCLIERGQEVGGEDQRSAFGTLARIVQAEQTEDGRWAVIAVGVNRIRIDEWLTDDPYPRAVISDWDDEAPTADPEAAYRDLRKKHRRVFAMASEAGFDVGHLPELADDPEMGSFQLTATAPISSFDRQRLLAAPGLDERLPMLNESLDAAMEFIQFELTRGEG